MRPSFQNFLRKLNTELLLESRNFFLEFLDKGFHLDPLIIACRGNTV